MDSKRLPLFPFHKRAKPVAIAVGCAHMSKENTGSWPSKSFDNQRNLSDADLSAYAKQIALDMAKDACVKSPEKVLAVIEKNTK